LDETEICMKGKYILAVVVLCIITFLAGIVSGNVSSQSREAAPVGAKTGAVSPVPPSESSTPAPPVAVAPETPEPSQDVTEPTAETYESSDERLKPVRQALDKAGGSWVRLNSADVVCDSEAAAACSDPAGFITVKNSYLDEDYAFWLYAMTHEYAHQVQFMDWNELEASPRYETLFNGDVEWLADCMSLSRYPNYTSGYGYACTAEQLAYSKQAWNKDF
jgi:hypothetical protein